MLVDINLIPKSSKKINILQISSILMGLLFVIGVTCIFLLHSHEAVKQDNLAKELEQIQTDVGLLEQKNSENVTPNTANNQMIKSLLEEKVATEKALKPYVKLLPKNSSILSLEYSHVGNVMIELQLSNYDEIASYLKDLADQESIEDVKLVSVSSSAEATGEKYIVQVDATFSKKLLKDQAGE